MKRPSARRRLRLALITTALFVCAAGTALATTALTGTQPTVIQTCKLNGIGTLRVVGAATDCNARLETPLSWNSQGPVGPPGATGAPGPRGEKGDTGVQGLPGPSSLAALAGSACHDHTGSAGTISIVTTTADDLVLHCSAAPSSGGTPPVEPPVHLASLTFQQYDATHYTVTVTLSGPASQTTDVSLSSSDPTSVSVPATVTVATGQTDARSEGSVSILNTAGSDITATLGGESIHATLTPS